MYKVGPKEIVKYNGKIYGAGDSIPGYIVKTEKKPEKEPKKEKKKHKKYDPIPEPPKEDQKEISTYTNESIDELIEGDDNG